MGRGTIITDLLIAPGGVREDLGLANIPDGSWSASSNFLVRNGTGRPRPGYTTVASSLSSASDIVTGFGYRGSPETAANLIAHTLTKAYNYDGSAFNDITGTWTTSTAAQPVRMAQFWDGTTLVIGRVNEANAVDKWTGAGNFQDATGAPAARDITVCGNRVILGYIATGGTFSQRVQWSGFKDIDSWTATDYDEATETPGDIVAVRALGPLSFGIYKEDAVLVGQLVDAATIFQFQFIGRTIGPAGPSALVATPDSVHYWMGKNGLLYRFDGAKPEVIGGLNKTALQGFAYSRRMEAHGSLLGGSQPEIWWWYPDAAASTMVSAACLNLTTMAVTPHTFRDSVTASAGWLSQGSLTYNTLPGTMDGLAALYATYDAMTSAALPSSILGVLTSGAVVYAAQFGLVLTDRDSSGPIAWSVTPATKALNGGGRVYMDGVRNYWRKTASTLTVTVGATISDALDDAGTETTSTFDMSAATTDGHLTVFSNKTGRYVTVRVAGASQVEEMQFRACDVLAWPRGPV